MEMITLTLPEWMLSPLFNGDNSGLTDEEEQALDTLGEYLNGRGFSGNPIDASEESDFYSYPPADARIAYGETLGGNYVEVTFPKI
jgi:hypothetical protein